MALVLGSVTVLPLSLVLLAYLLGVGHDVWVFRVAVGLTPAVFLVAIVGRELVTSRAGTLSLTRLVGPDYRRLGAVVRSADGARSLTWLCLVVDGASVHLVVGEYEVSGRLEQHLYRGVDADAYVLRLEAVHAFESKADYRIPAPPREDPRQDKSVRSYRGTLGGREIRVDVERSGQVACIQFDGSIGQAVSSLVVPSG